MKAIYSGLLLSCLTWSINVYGQKKQVVIENLRESSVYVGVDNRLAIAVNGYKGDLKVITDNGTVKKGKEGEYIWRPEELGFSCLMIVRKTKTSTDTISHNYYGVINFDRPVLSFGWSTNGTISYSDARHTGLGVKSDPSESSYVNDKYGRPEYRINEFTLVVIRDDKLILRKKLKSMSKEDELPFSDKEAAETMSTLMPKDIVLFNDIKVKGLIGSKEWIFNISPMVLNITD